VDHLPQPDEAERDAAQREAAIARIRAELDRTTTARTRAREQARPAAPAGTWLQPRGAAPSSRPSGLRPRLPPPPPPPGTRPLSEVLQELRDEERY
jgi:hypothetical protein